MRRLLLQVVSVLLTAGAQGANIGEYVYSPTAKYKVTGENLVTNGDFSQGDGLQGWANETGGNVAGDVWRVVTNAGPNGQNVIQSQGASTAEGSQLCCSWMLTSGLYTVTYWVKAESNLLSSVTAGGHNCVNLTAQAAEGGLRTLAESEGYTTDWRQVVDTISVQTASETVTFTAGNVAIGTAFTGFEIHKVDEVFDTRKTDRLVAYIEQLLAEESLTEGRTDMLEVLNEALKPILQDAAQSESLSYMESLMEQVEGVIGAFLDQNGGNLVGIYLKDWSEWSSTGFGKVTTRDTWTFGDSRAWGFSNNDATCERPADDGPVASVGIQTGYQLNVGVRSKDGALSMLPPGKYFFKIEAQAVAAANRAAPYGSNRNVEIKGPQIIVGNDTTVLADAVLNDYYWQTFYKIAEVKEGEEVKVAFWFPLVDGNTGGRYSLRYPEVRQLGVDNSQLQFNLDKSNILTQQSALKERLDTYPTELKDYAWEQDSLQRAIDAAKVVYEASLGVIDANGNVVDASQVNADYTALLLAEVNRLGKARSWVIDSNAPIQNLKTALEAAKASLDNPDNALAAAAQRNVLETAVSAAQALIDGISSENQGESFNAAIETLQKAQEEFEATTATRANPTEIVIKNGSFQDFSAGNNVTSQGATKDWNWSWSASTSRWEIRDNETLSDGHGASIWRGTTVQLDGKAQQTVDLPYEGLYEYRAEAYISEERLTELTNAAVCEILYDEETGVACDTIYKPNIRLFFGIDGRPDSITISKCYLGVKADGSYFSRAVSGTDYPGQVYATYSVFFNKTGAGATTAEFGLEAFDNFAAAGANGFGFGANKVYFVGNETQYLTDTRKELDAAVASARQTAQDIDNYWVTKLNRYIADAQKATTAKDMQNALHGLKEVESRIKGIATSVKGVFVNEPQREVAKGVYTLSGVKVADESTNLKPGLYIINGKKYVIK